MSASLWPDPTKKEQDQRVQYSKAECSSRILSVTSGERGHEDCHQCDASNRQ